VVSASASSIPFEIVCKVNTLSAEGKLAEGAASEALTVEGTQARDCVAGLLQEQAPTAIA
jgi:hypothetical protein